MMGNTAAIRFLSPRYVGGLGEVEDSDKKPDNKKIKIIFKYQLL
jgi:hypothetical protein